MPVHWNIICWRNTGIQRLKRWLRARCFISEFWKSLDFHDIIVSLKASDVPMAIAAYTKAAEVIPYPLHLGITEAGTLFSGTIKSAAGLGALLSLGIGSTVRVSLSADPVEEVKVARELLKSFGLISNAATLVSCPTCGRLDIDLFSIANEVEEYISKIKVPIKVSVLGCAVNGPGEAREADIGIAGARGEDCVPVRRDDPQSA